MDPVGTEAAAVVAHVVGELELVGRHGGLDELRHGAVVAVEQRVQGRQVRLGPEPLAQLEDAPGGGAARGDDRVQVARFQVFILTWLRMSPSASSFSSPLRYSLVGGMRTPSS